MVTIHITSHNRQLTVPEGENLLNVLQRSALVTDAPCGGLGKCGKCRVLIRENGEWISRLSCRTAVTRDMEISIPTPQKIQVLHPQETGSFLFDPPEPGYSLAIDIGTTTVVCSLLDSATGKELAAASCQNPQSAFGADVISRVQHQIKQGDDLLTRIIRDAIEDLIQKITRDTSVDPRSIGLICVAANPSMEQLFLGMPLDNLVTVPFGPAILHTQFRPAAPYLPSCSNARLLVMPEVSGYVGGDTLSCLLAVPEEFYSETSLLVDIGTNGEMVLSHQGQLFTCSTAAGPALEGAGIRMGMRGAPGAIDHIRVQEGQPQVHVIGEVSAAGICGSGLIDGAAFLLETGIINARGRMQQQVPGYEGQLRLFQGDRAFYFTDQVCMTQEDIRAFQLAKSAIATGIQLMLEQAGIGPDALDRIYLAGAFGSFLDPQSACRTGLLPRLAPERITVLGNAAGSGAKRLARDRSALEQLDSLAGRITFLELAELPGFRRCFGKNMNFR